MAADRELGGAGNNALDPLAKAASPEYVTQQRTGFFQRNCFKGLTVLIRNGGLHLLGANDHLIDGLTKGHGAAASTRESGFWESLALIVNTSPHCQHLMFSACLIVIAPYSTASTPLG